MALTGLDLAIIATYLGAVTLIGVLSARRATSWVLKKSWYDRLEA
jgi:hypothetical protein